MQQPPVSVVMCTYNGSAFVKEQVQSILKQDYPVFELLVVDDASTDGTAAIIKQLQTADNRIRLVVNEQNLGYNRNFEKAIMLAAHRHIAISDQDDIWHPEKISIMMREWPPGKVMIYSISSDFDSDNPVFGPGNNRVNYKHFDNPAMLVFDSPVHGHACMVLKDFATGCTPFPANIFYDWWLSMFAAGNGALGFVNHTLTWHRVHGANASRNITSIADTNARKRQLVQQKIHFISTILNTMAVPEAPARLLKKYQTLLERHQPGRFSMPLARFFFNNRRVVFHYKKKIRLISALKRSIKKSYWGL